MAVNVVDVQEHQTLSIESVHPKLRAVKSHPYLNIHSTPNFLPKPSHIHQLSDQTGQKTHKHQLSTISLPQQLPVKSQINNSFGKEDPSKPTNFNQSIYYGPIYSEIDKSIQQKNHISYQTIDKQSNSVKENIEKYDSTHNHNDLTKVSIDNEKIYINQPNTVTENKLKNNLTNGHSDSSLSEYLINGYGNKQQKKIKNEMDDQINYHQVNNYFNEFEIHKKFDSANTQSTYHGLPMKFVKALKKLFDIFDVNKCGLIRIVDIETKIRDENFDEELDRPQDLIESLRKVTSPNGLINFSNFCAAINICLLKNQLAKNKSSCYKSIKTKGDRNDSYLKAQNIDKNWERNGFLLNRNVCPSQISGCTSNQTLNEIHHSKYSSKNSSFFNSNSPIENGSFTSTSSSNSSSRLHKDFNKFNIKSPKNAISINRLKYRPSSVPIDFNNDQETNCFENNNLRPSRINKKLDEKAKSMGNLKEQVYVNKLRLCSSESRMPMNTIISRQAIMEKLIEWRNNMLEKKLKLMNGRCDVDLSQLKRPPLTFTDISQANPSSNHLYSIVNKNPKKRHETRRHTMTSLHSINTTRKLFNMQKEKDLLHQGTIIIDRARQFYLRQIDILRNQIDYLNQHIQSGKYFFIDQLNNDYNIKQHLNKINTLDQINRNLILLMDNQFVQANQSNDLLPEIEVKDFTIFKLKEQIRLLNDELTRKSDIIKNLERANPFLKINF